MALSQKHRSVLFDHFAPQVGDDVAEALMAEFPSRDGDELVTKDFLRAELNEQLVKVVTIMTGVVSLGVGIILGFG